MVLTSHKTRDPYMGSPKSRVRVSREYEREKESRVPKRGKSREVVRGKAWPWQTKNRH
jgi:hypothetical protein